MHIIKINKFTNKFAQIQILKTRTFKRREKLLLFKIYANR